MPPNIEDILAEAGTDEPINPLEDQDVPNEADGSDGEGAEGEGTSGGGQSPTHGSASPAWPPRVEPAGGNQTAGAGDPFPTLSDEQLRQFSTSTNDPLFANALAAREKVRTLQDAARMTAQAATAEQLRTAFDLKAVQDFPALADSTSPLFKRTMAEIQALTAGGYTGPDLNLRAATAAAVALKQGPDMEKSRTRRIEQSSTFEKPSRRDRTPNDDSPVLGPREKQLAEQMGITSPEGLKAFKTGMRQAADEVRRRGQ